MRPFAEIADTVAHGLRVLGHDVSVCGDPIDVSRRNIVFRPHAERDVGRAIRPGSILYNWEQLDEQSPWVNDQFMRRARLCEVWDYSLQNVAWWAKQGVPAKHVPIGYYPGLERIAAEPPEYDVLFYGGLSHRRTKLLRDLKERGLSLQVVDSRNQRWSTQLDSCIARAKIVVNLHFYERVHIFEVARVSYLLANGVCVVSETGQDRADESQWDGGLVWAPYDSLAEECCRVVSATADERAEIGRRGQGIMRSKRIEDILAAALK